ncbi:unnamed protein product [Prorocentrum cordatum]|nr:unnamed protein product [Polarella glacialis]
MWEQLFAASHSRLQQGLCICARLEFRGPALSSSAAARGVGPRGSPGAGGPTIVCGDVGIWHTARASLWAGALNEEKKKGWSAGCAPGECTPPARAGGGEERGGGEDATQEEERESRKSAQVVGKISWNRGNSPLTATGSRWRTG